MKKVAIIGWRGMVGSVLMERMRAEDDFKDFTQNYAEKNGLTQKEKEVMLYSENQ